MDSERGKIRYGREKSFPASSSLIRSVNAMSTEVLNSLIKQAETLTVEEQLRLVAELVEKVRAAHQWPKPRRKWAEICGAAPYPLLGEDAQAWVSRTRREGTEERERQLNPQS